MDRSERRYDLFISYADADGAWVEGYLLDALDRAGARVHTEEAFALGAPRLLEFERAVRESQRTLLVLSPAYLAESFAQFADLLAQTYGLETSTWPVIPLVLHEVQLPPRLAMLTRLDGRDPDRWAEVMERLCAALQRPVPGPPPAPACPYPGMVPFGEADSDRFYGREEEVQALVDRLRLHPFLTVIGPSGSGKSSLVFAGLVPALRRSTLFGRGARWQVCALRPGESPHRSLTDALRGVARPDGHRLLLVVDQFEELFTLARDEQVHPFQEMLQRLIQAPNCYVVLTVRADFYPDLMATPLWGAIQAHRFEVLPLDGEGLRQAIVRPAEDVGVFVETALVERLVTDAGREPGVLPLVQEALVLLWEHLERRFLPLRAYSEALVLPRRAYGEPPLTGLQVAIARRADAALAGLGPAQQATARRIFLRLVQFGEGRADTRRQQRVQQLRTSGDDAVLFERTLHYLASHRLLTLGGEEESAWRTVDIAHEALIAGWPTLQGWLAERREAEQTRRRLEGKAAEWERLGRGEGGLLDLFELQEAETWLDSPDAGELGGGSEALGALVERSRAAIEAAEREQSEQQLQKLEAAQKLAAEQERRAAAETQRADDQARSASKLRRLAIVLALVFLLAAGAAVTAGVLWRKTARAEEAAVTAEAAAVAGKGTAVAAEATAVAGKETAVVAQTTAVAGEAAAVAAEATAEARRLEALSHALASSALLSQDRGELDLALLLSVQAFRISPTALAKKTLYDLLLGNRYLEGLLPQLTDRFVTEYKLGFNAAGTRLVARIEEYGWPTYLLWDLSDLGLLDELSPEGEDVSIEIDAGGNQLIGGRNQAGGSRRQQVNWPNPEESRTSRFGDLGERLWENPIVSPDGGIVAGAICRERGAIATGGSCDGFQVIVASTSSSFGPTTLPFGDGKPKPLGLAFDQSQRLWVIAEAGDGRVGLWKQGSESLASAGTLDLPVSVTQADSLAFSAEAGRVAWKEDGSVVVASTETSELSCALPLGLQVYDLALSPDGKRLATLGDSGIQLWESTDCSPSSERRLDLPAWLQEELKGGSYSGVLEFSGDGKMIALGTRTRILLWGIGGDRYRDISLTTYPDSSINAMALDFDGNTIAASLSPGEATQVVRLMLVDVDEKVEIGPLAQFDLFLHVGRTGKESFLPALSPDGQTLAAMSAETDYETDGLIWNALLWDIDPERWMERACRIANRNLTQDEWQQYVGDDPYCKTCPELPPGEGAPEDATACQPGQ